jgi:hypothetical protein
VVAVALSPTSASVLLGDTQQFTANVTGTTNTTVTWTVNGTTGGSSTIGTVSSSGSYTAPQDLPSAASVTVTATSQADATKSASASVAITSDIALSIRSSPTASSILTGAMLQLTAVMSSKGHPDNTVTWSVNGIQNGNATVGTVATTGPNTATYTAPLAVPNPNAVTIAATSVADPTKSATALVTINPGQPTVTLNTPASGATQLSGYAYNFAPGDEIVIYVLTNEWYVQPYVDAPFTTISADGSWTSYTHPWQSIVVLLVNPANYTPAATEITNPALDPGVIAWTAYPPGQVSAISFSGRTWGIKTTGTAPGDEFDPGPNFFSDDPSVVSVGADGLHLKINQINGLWQCGEVYLLESLGYGTYTVKVSSHLDNLDKNTVAAPLFIYAAPGQELDIEYSGADGLIPSPYTGQFVVQPYTVPGNIMRYTQPSTAQFTVQMEWQADHVTFSAWNGWSAVPAASDMIYQWTYTASYIPPVGQERVHINLWVLNGNAPVRGVGDEMVISSFNFQPSS